MTLCCRLSLAHGLGVWAHHHLQRRAPYSLRGANTHHSLFVRGRVVALATDDEPAGGSSEEGAVVVRAKLCAY